MVKKSNMVIESIAVITTVIFILLSYLIFNSQTIFILAIALLLIEFGALSISFYLFRNNKNRTSYFLLIVVIGFLIIAFFILQYLTVGAAIIHS